jgi:hypothetical protein
VVGLDRKHRQRARDRVRSIRNVAKPKRGERTDVEEIAKAVVRDGSVVRFENKKL